MSAQQVVSTDQRLRPVLAAVVLAATFLIGAIAGATVPSIVAGVNHAGSGAAAPVALPASRDDMSSAAYAALHQAAGAAQATGGDMSSAAYTALHPAPAAAAPIPGDMSSAAYVATHAALAAVAPIPGDMSSAAYSATHPAK